MIKTNMAPPAAGLGPLNLSSLALSLLALVLSGSVGSALAMDISLIGLFPGGPDHRRLTTKINQTGPKIS